MENYNIVNLTNTGIKITESMKIYVNAHATKIENMLESFTNQATLITSFKKSKDLITFEITIKFRNKTILGAKGKELDYYDAVDIAFEKIRKNIRNYKEKNTSIEKRVHKSKTSFLIDDIKEQILREKEIDCVAMSIEGAVTQLEQLDHDFFLFLDKVTLLPCVVYRRINDGYGVLKLKTLGE